MAAEKQAVLYPPPLTRSRHLAQDTIEKARLGDHLGGGGQFCMKEGGPGGWIHRPKNKNEKNDCRLTKNSGTKGNWAKTLESCSRQHPRTHLRNFPSTLVMYVSY